MQNYTSTKLFYYICLNFIGLGIVTGLVGLLNWPLLAEIPLAASIYIEIIALGRYVFNSLNKNTEYSFMKLISDLKLQLKQLEKAEKEIS